jgi:hypothetical protein
MEFFGQVELSEEPKGDRTDDHSSRIEKDGGEIN